MGKEVPRTQHSMRGTGGMAVNADPNGINLHVGCVGNIEPTCFGKDIAVP